VGSRTWFAGREICLGFAVPSMGAPGDWRMAADTVNDQPAASAWFRGERFGTAVLTVTADGIRAVTLFTGQ
jgi:RNA polymerase sigma-70 factor (ECF subfamily)